MKFETEKLQITKKHKGVYGIIRQGKKILVIKKARGPYTGLYDLPGGTPEENETPEQTLIREIKEETNCDVVQYKNKREKVILFTKFLDKNNQPGCFQHTGILFDVDVVGEPSSIPDGLDSNGAIWMDINLLDDTNATPFVLIGCGKRE